MASDTVSTRTSDGATTGPHVRATWPRLAVAGSALGGLAAFVGAAALFPDPLAGATTAAEMAERLAGTQVGTASLLLLCYALLSSVVVGALSDRVGGDGAAARLVPVLGVAHLLLTAGAFAGLAGAVAVGTHIFDSVSPAAAETGLVIMNAVFPVAQFTGAAFLLAVLVTALAAGRMRWVAITAGLFALGLVSPLGWAALYLLPLWFAAVGVTLAVRR